MPDIENIKSLISRRNELCVKILELTESAGFGHGSGDLEKNAERYTELYEKRDALVAGLAKIHDEIGAEGYALAKESGGAEISALLNESEKRLNRIVELDKYNKEYALLMQKSAQEHIRRINQGRAASNKYSDSSETDGFLVDNKN